jgi:hypothetical protein
MLLNTVCEKTKYGRLYAPDPRDMEFKLRASPVRAALVREERMWRTGAVLDQGPFPHCVGYAVYQFLISAPFMARKGRVLPGPVDIYNGAQDNDEWFGNNYEGTSGRGALKWLMKQGIVSNFRMAPDGPTMKNYILLESGLMVGTEWFMGMSNPKWLENKNGTRSAWIEPTGAYEGGHETFWCGFSKKRDAYRVLNSWGPGYGENGRVWIDRQVAEHLVFGLNGDAYAAMEIM